MFRWVQLPLAEVQAMETNGEIPIGEGYRYLPDSETHMVEYHVDFNATFQDRMSNTQFGGNLSVRKPANEKPLFSFGQDEYIFKQFSFSPKGWTAPDGTKPILPKDDVYGIMISAMASRDFVFGMNLTDAQLQLLKDCRETTT